MSVTNRLLGLFRQSPISRYVTSVGASFKPYLGKVVATSQIDRHCGYENGASLLSYVGFAHGFKFPFLGLSTLAMAPALTIAVDEESSGTEDMDDATPIVAPKGKHLWCLKDSYGYTKGIFRLSMTFCEIAYCYFVI